MSKLKQLGLDHWIAGLALPAVLGVILAVATRQNDLWRIILAVAIAGCCGGLLANMFGGDTPVLPGKVPSSVEGAPVPTKAFHPGTVGNVFAGGLAALALFALYGPLKDVAVVGHAPAAPVDPHILNISLSALLGGVISGIGGTQILTNLVTNSIQTAQKLSTATIPSGQEEALAKAQAIVASPKLVLPD